MCGGGRRRGRRPRRRRGVHEGSAMLRPHQRDPRPPMGGAPCERDAATPAAAARARRALGGAPQRAAAPRTLAPVASTGGRERAPSTTAIRTSTQPLPTFLLLRF
ncbi:unnamed protein product [Plutella xylostella]|uniref:(diamondback moth) hypothetical protein n=1 Tax=Plutella xylostella TaxID=51655 RepID=A0A8S4GCC1_PLUXY|nr:unnamed protein product [Plutella xylostella]